MFIILLTINIGYSLTELPVWYLKLRGSLFVYM